MWREYEMQVNEAPKIGVGKQRHEVERSIRMENRPKQARDVQPLELA